MIETTKIKTDSKRLLSDLVTFSKYARYDKTKHRREVADEILNRYQEMMVSKFPDLEAIINEAMEYAFNKKIVPSMRAMQFSGKPIELNNNRIFNCAFLNMDNVKSFSEIMYLLLGGTGVGYSVQKRHINHLPSIKPVRNKPLQQFSIPDSIEGWAEAVERLFESYTNPSKPFTIFNYDLIREQGKPIETAGGFAPGSEPLKIALENVNNILYHAQGRLLKPIDVFDINNYIAQAVYSGGIRRSATICLFDRNDEAMLDSKSGDWWTKNPERAMANISAVLPRNEVRKNEFTYIYNKTKASNSGEPGFYWTDNPDLGANPCCEISLRSNTFCNLSELSVESVGSQEDFERAALAATVLGTLQAAFTDLKKLRPIWKERTLEDSLIGVSLTGIAAYKDFPFELEPVVSKMIEKNKEIAKLININPAKRITTIKPSGTASLYFGTSSGIHPYYSSYYLRRVRVLKTDILSEVFHVHNPDFITPDTFDDTNNIISIPIKAPETAITSDEGAIDMLKRIRFFSGSWIKNGHIDGDNTNNVSATVYVRKNEWDDVKQFMWENRDAYNGLTVLPYDDHSYNQAPFEEISENEYNRLMDLLNPIDFSKIKEQTDHTNPSGEIACSGGACEIKQL